MKTYLHDPLTTKEVQELLCFHDVGVDIDGDSGSETTTGVKYFQTLFGRLDPNGILDAATVRFLREPLDYLSDLPTKVVFLGKDAANMGVVLPTFALEYHKRRFREVGGDNRGPCVRMVSEGADGPGTQWCANFATFVLQQAWDVVDAALKAAGKKGLPYTRNRYRTGWTPAIKDRALSDGRLISSEEAVKDPSRIKPGMFFLVRGAKRIVHVGIVTIGGNSKGKFCTVEGNATDDDPTRAYEVARRVRDVRSCDFVDLLRGT